MTALDVAAGYGLPLRQKGARYWARCPLHGEKTASLCFFPDGRWYCFGCHRHGDAADLYAALYGVPLAEALRAVKGTERPRGPYKPTAAELRRRVEDWKGERWAEACEQKHAARAIMMMLEKEGAGLDSYWRAARQAGDAEDALNLLESATPAQLLKMMAEGL
ncbi:MAG: CHC2 zinc finger domain-containing protein [Clostridiales bacterium]|nr:CHC2 zinc finger domain-containing protein [Clostridiales bacterium]